MKHNTAALIVIPLAALVVGGGAGVASAFDQPHPTGTHPASQQMHVTTGTPSGQAATARLTATVRQQTTPTARPAATAVGHMVTTVSHPVERHQVAAPVRATQQIRLAQHVGEHAASSPMGQHTDGHAQGCN
jgi:hypothetical protein